MLHLQISIEHVERLRRELRGAGSREIGGVLVGEHVSNDTFRIVDFSVQRSGGSVACFVRRPEEHDAFLEGFFARTGQDYTRFNYLGEWHSHPSFRAYPSSTDLAAMQEIVEDEAQGTKFAALLVVNLDWRRRLCVNATVFRAGIAVEQAKLSIFQASATKAGRWLNRTWCRQLRLTSNNNP